MKKIIVVGLLLVTGVSFAGSGGRGVIDPGSYKPSAVQAR